MKVIITGATGFVGSECLRQCLSHPKITSVVTLSRRALADSQAKDVDPSHPKLQSIIQEDMTKYTPEILQKLEGAEACIWSLGTVPKKHETNETAKTALDIPQAAIDAWNGKLKAPGSGPFRFVLVSGAMVERDQAKSPMMMGEFLKMRGETENKLAAAEEANPDTWKAFFLRMGKVLPASGSLIGMVVSWGVIKVDEAAACMVELAVNGGDKQTLSNDEMKTLGKQALGTS